MMAFSTRGIPGWKYSLLFHVVYSAKIGQNLGFRDATKSSAVTRPIRTFAFSIFSSDAIFSHQQRAENETEDAVRTSVERQ